MEESEALRIGREAVQAAKQKFGDDEKAIAHELELRARRDRNLFEAFAIVGHLLVSASQGESH